MAFDASPASSVVTIEVTRARQVVLPLSATSLGLIHVLTMVTHLEAQHADLLEQVMADPRLTVDDLTEAGVFSRPKVGSLSPEGAQGEGHGPVRPIRVGNGPTTWAGRGRACVGVWSRNISPVRRRPALVLEAVPAGSRPGHLRRGMGGHLPHAPGPRVALTGTWTTRWPGCSGPTPTRRGWWGPALSTWVSRKATGSPSGATTVASASTQRSFTSRRLPSSSRYFRQTTRRSRNCPSTRLTASTRCSLSSRRARGAGARPGRRPVRRMRHEHGAWRQRNGFGRRHPLALAPEPAQTKYARVEIVADGLVNAAGVEIPAGKLWPPGAAI